MKFTSAIIIIFLIFISCNSTDDKTGETVTAKSNNAVPIINYSVVSTLPHNTTSFTEGFLFYNDQLYESTGHTEDIPSTRSLFGEVNLKTGNVAQYL